MIDLIAAAFLIAGTAFLMISALGLIRFPDFWTRAHAVAKAETLGLVLVFIGLIVLNRFGPGSLQLALIAAFSLLVNPTAIHALARSALRGGGPANKDAADSPGEPHSDAAGGPR